MIGQAVEAVTEQIRAASDVVDVVGAYVTLRRAGRVFKGLCPFHNEKTPSFNVNPEKQIFKCFGCGAGGDVFKFIQRRENVSFPEARQILATRAGIELAAERSKGKDGIGRPELERVNRWATAWFASQFSGGEGPRAREYAARRGFSPDTLTKFDIGFAPDSWDSLVSAAARQRIPNELLLAAGLIKVKEDSGRPYDAFRNRLIFPIRDALGRVLAFGGRTLGDDPAKYLNSPQSLLFDKGRCLYGLATAKNSFSQARTAIVVEGYIDCILVQQHGFENTVATLGTALTPEHVQVLRRYVDSVILVFDSDEAGQRAADRALELSLVGQLDVRLARVPKGKDPAEYLQTEGSAGFQQVLTSSTGALQFKWKQVLASGQTGTSGAGERRAIEDFLGLVARSRSLSTADPIQKGLIVNQLAKLLSLPSEEVYRHLTASARRLGPVVDGVVGRASAPQRRPSSVEAVATREMLEVLLNEPTYYDSVASQFEPELLDDEQERLIAHATVEIARGGTETLLADLMTRFESIEVAQRITELHLAGERRGNFAGTIEGAVTRLQHLREQRKARELVDDLRPEAGATESESIDSDRLRAAGESVRRARHFAARRHLSGVRPPAGSSRP